MAAIPAALDRDDPSTVVSHAGATFGGLCAAPGADATALLEAACTAWRERGATRLVYKPVPSMYHRSPFADDLYALARLGARRRRADLASVIDLAEPPRLSSRRRRATAKADREGVEVVEGPERLAELWVIVTAVLAERHGVAPVHTLAEIDDLRSRFPEEIRVVTGTLGGDVVAGAVLFVSERVTHAQYLASDETGRRTGALDRVLVHAIEAARADGGRFFDFGRSTEGPDARLNVGLHTYKQEFGAGSVVYEQLEVDL